MDSRAEFEAWAETQSESIECIYELFLSEDEKGNYVDGITQTAAKAFKAGQASRQALSSCSENPNSSDPASRQALECEPFTWVFTDVNGQAKEIADDPVHRSPQDLRIYTVLYTYPAGAVVREEKKKSFHQGQTELMTQFCVVINEMLEGDLKERYGLLEPWGSTHERLKTRLSNAASAVPEGWKLVPIESSFAMEDTGCGAYMEADGNLWMHYSSMGHAYKAMIDAAPCVSQPTESAKKAWIKFQSMLGPDDPAKSVSTDRPTLGQRKADQVGKTIGVLVQRDDGKVAAVTDMGRCTWLSQGVTGAGDGVSVPDIENECPACGGDGGLIQPGYPNGALYVCPECDGDGTTPTKADEAVSVPEIIKALADKMEVAEGEDVKGGYMWDASDCAEFMREEAGKIATTPTKADGWIKCSERLPHEGDGHIWIFDDRGRLVLGPYEWDMLEPDMGETHWMRTGLVMPDMPKQEQGK